MLAIPQQFRQYMLIYTAHFLLALKVDVVMLVGFLTCICTYCCYTSRWTVGTSLFLTRIYTHLCFTRRHHAWSCKFYYLLAFTRTVAVKGVVISHYFLLSGFGWVAVNSLDGVFHLAPGSLMYEIMMMTMMMTTMTMMMTTMMAMTMYGQILDPLNRSRRWCKSGYQPSCSS